MSPEGPIEAFQVVKEGEGYKLEMSEDALGVDLNSSLVTILFLFFVLLYQNYGKKSTIPRCICRYQRYMQDLQ